MFRKKFLKIFLCDSRIDLVIDLDGNSDAITFTDAKAARKRNLIAYSGFLNGILQKLHYFRRALQIAGAPDADLYCHILYLCANVCLEEFFDCVGGYGIKFVINRYAYALLTFAEAECGSKLDLIAEVVLCNKILELFNYLS